MELSAATIVVRTVTVPMRDGVALVADVVHPDRAAPGPILLTRTPYGRSSAWRRGEIIELARAGWRVVIQDVRGRGASGGQFIPFATEAADGQDTIRWLRAQPWCDGRVVMFGGSYVAATQWLAAMDGPPGLVAIAPECAGASYGEGWAFENGIATEGFLESWALRFATTGSAPSAAEAERGRRLADAGVPTRPSTTRSAQIAAAFPPARSWLPPVQDARWQALDVLSDEVPDIAAFHVTGWFDLFCEGSLRAYAAAAARSAAPQRLIIGPWWHGGIGSTVVGDVSTGAHADAERIGLWAQQWDWLRRAVDADPDLPVGARVFVVGEGWRELAGRPPPAEPHRLALDGDRRLVDGPARTPHAIRTVTHRPARPAPSSGGRTFWFWPRSGPVDQATVENHPDVLSYTSAPLAADLVILGMVRCTLSVESTSAEATVVLRLCDVDEDGRSIGIVEQGHRLVDRRETRDYPLDVGSVGWRMAAGHRVRLQIAPASWPRLAAPTTPFRLRVAQGSGSGSFLLLPTVSSERGAHREDVTPC